MCSNRADLGVPYDADYTCSRVPLPLVLEQENIIRFPRPGTSLGRRTDKRRPLSYLCPSMERFLITPPAGYARQIRPIILTSNISRPRRGRASTPDAPDAFSRALLPALPRSRYSISGEYRHGILLHRPAGLTRAGSPTNEAQQRGDRGFPRIAARSSALGRSTCERRSDDNTTPLRVRLIADGQRMNSYDDASSADLIYR